MSQVVSFLTSPDGVLVEHAVVLLCVAVLGYFQAKIQRQTKAVEQKLDGRLSLLEAEVASTATVDPSPPTTGPSGH